MRKASQANNITIDRKGGTFVCWQSEGKDAYKFMAAVLPC